MAEDKDISDISALDRRHLWHPFTQAQTAAPAVEIVSGAGARLTDSQGREYLDLVSSWWVTLHGHAHPAIAGAVAEQAGRLEQVNFADFTHAPAVNLAARLCALLPGDLSRVFFSDNGSTAVEVAMKLAWQYWRNEGNTKRRRFLALAGGYHGDTLGAMSVGASSGFYAPFSDLVFDVDFIPFAATWDGDNAVAEKESEALAVLDQILDDHGRELAAAVIEPLVQGAGGMNMCRPEFVRALCERLRAAGVLLIFDEVMTGFGRTGHMFACLKAAVTPDFICLAKGMTGGFLPLAATVCGEDIFAAFLGETFDTAFAHGHSFSANPLGCAAALASLDLFESEKSLQRVKAMEDLHRQRVDDLARLPNVVKARVTGSIAAFNVEGGGEGYGAAIGERLKRTFLKRGLLLRPLGDVVYLMPPYCIEAEALHGAYDVISATLSKV